MFLFISTLRTSWYSWLAHGTTNSLNATAPILIMNAVINTGIASLVKLCPAERITISSLDPDNLEKHMRDPNNTAIGNVYTTILGSASMKILIAEVTDAPYLVTYSAIFSNVSDPTKIAVNAATPNRKGPINCFNIYLSSMRIA